MKQEQQKAVLSPLSVSNSLTSELIVLICFNVLSYSIFKNTGLVLYNISIVFCFGAFFGEIYRERHTRNLLL